MKRIIAFLLCILFCFTVLLPFSLSASADALTATIIAGASYAIGSTFGVNFAATGWNATQAGNMMVTEVNSYVGQRSIADVFGSEAIRAVAGKMVVGQVAYNSIVSFLNYLCTKYNLGLNRVGIGFMFQDDYVSLNGTVPLSAMNGWYLDITAGTRYWTTIWTNGTSTSPTQYNDVPVNSYTPGSPVYTLFGTSGINAKVTYSDAIGRTYTRNHGNLSFSTIWPDAADRPKQVTGQSTGDIGSATVLNPGYGWSGEVNGYEGPDTNLDQLVGQIFGDVADFNLDVDGEVIPLDPPQPVETWVPVDDVIDGINQGGDVLTDIGNDIGDISGHLDDLGEIGQDIVGELEGVQEGIETQTGVISGALNDAAQDIVDAIGDQTSTLDESLTNTAEGVETIVEALEDETINWQKFDLRGLFPFCIPFDIYNMLEALDASPTAPHVQLPFQIASIGFNYTIDLDFSAFDQVAAVMRQMELIVYGIALAWATSKVIKW